MAKKRKRSEKAEVAALVEKDIIDPERPKRTLFGWKDKPEEKEKETEHSGFRNKEKVLVTCSCHINYRYRHLMLNVVSILPQSKGWTLNELVELKSCSSCLFFEVCARVSVIVSSDGADSRHSQECSMRVRQNASCLEFLTGGGAKMDEKSQVGSEKYAADISSIREAHERIKTFIHTTPVLSSETLNSMSGRSLHFKCECFQKGGAFKFRGACNAIFSLDDEQAARGVVTHSSGNHAAALSLAAKLRGIPGYIVIPKNAPKCKVENVIRYGGQVIWSEATMKSREETARKVLQETGAVLIHPYNDGRVISGQGTIALELLEQAPQIDIIIVPISGGGLISGVALAAKSINPAIRVLAAEPKGANDAAQSKAAGRIITLPETNTVADGLRAFLGDFTWPVVRDLVDDIIVVDDKEILEAMRLCYEILKVAVEPSGAIGLAAVLSDNFKKNPLWKDCNNVGIILSGGNVDLGVLWDSYE